MSRSSRASANVTRRLLPRLLLAGGSVLAACLVMEVMVRLFMQRHYDTEALRTQLTSTSIKPLITLADDPELMYVLRSNLDTRFHASTVRTDADGVRIGERGVGTRPESLRIALLGDSTPFGWRVEYEATYGERLREELARHTSVPVVVRNYSVPGYNAAQAERIFAKSVLAFAPHLLIVHHDHNDSQPTGWGYTSWLPPEYGDNPIGSALLKVLLRKLKTATSATSTAAEPGHDLISGYYASGPLYDAMLASRVRLLAAARAHGIPVVALLFNCQVLGNERYEESPTYQRLHRQLAERLSAMGYHVLDLYPVYQTFLKRMGLKDLRTLWVDDEDQHPNPEGHKFIADALVDFLQRTPALKKVILN